MNKKTIPRKESPRCTDAEKFNRICKIEDWLRDGLDNKAIYRMTLKDDPPWKIEAQQVDRYIHEILEEWRKIRKYEEPFKVEKALGKRAQLAKRAIMKDDLRTALACYDSEAKIEGILTDNFNVRGSVEIRSELDLSKLTDEELVDLKKLQDKAKKNESV
jgi:hypothetical protein